MRDSGRIPTSWLCSFPYPNLQSRVTYEMGGTRLYIYLVDYLEKIWGALYLYMAPSTP